MHRSVPQCPARHLRTWLTTYTWFRKVQDVDSARPRTDRVLFHGRTTHLVTEALLPPGHVFGTASQHTCATKTSVITVFGVNSKRFGFNVASGAQCDILVNCAIQILLLNHHAVIGQLSGVARSQCLNMH